MRITPLFTCVECDRVFDLRDQMQATEFYNGHDCEASA